MLWSYMRTPQMDYFIRIPKFPSFSTRSKVPLWPSENPRSSLLEGLEEEAVPKGFLAVYVGEEMRRFVIPTSYLSLPEFKVLMEIAAEEFGYGHTGGLRIPCNENEFERTLKSLDRGSKQEKKRDAIFPTSRT